MDRSQVSSWKGTGSRGGAEHWSNSDHLGLLQQVQAP